MPFSRETTGYSRDAGGYQDRAGGLYPGCEIQVFSKTAQAVLLVRVVPVRAVHQAECTARSVGYPLRPREDAERVRLPECSGPMGKAKAWSPRSPREAAERSLVSSSRRGGRHGNTLWAHENRFSESSVRSLARLHVRSHFQVHIRRCTSVCYATG